MFIELTEVLACPVCLEGRGAAPAQGLVALVDSLRGRHVWAGYLGCPQCEARYPVRAGVVDLRRREGSHAAAPDAERTSTESPHAADAPPAESSSAADRPPAAPEKEGRHERALELAALLGLTPEGGGYVLLDAGLAGSAEALATIIPRVELLGFVDRAAAGEEGNAKRVSYAAVSPSGPLPIVSGRLRGIALQGGSEDRWAEAARALAPGGRLVVLEPGPAARRLVSGLPGGPLRVVAAEERALVALRG